MKAVLAIITRTIAERQEGVRHQLVAVFRQKPLRPEDFRFGVVAGVVVQRIHRHVHLGVLLQLDTGQLVAVHAHSPLHSRHQRLHAKRFLDDRLQQGTSAHNEVVFGQLLHHIGRRGGGRLEAGGEEDDALGDYLLLTQRLIKVTFIAHLCGHLLVVSCLLFVGKGVNEQLDQIISNSFSLPHNLPREVDEEVERPRTDGHGVSKKPVHRSREDHLRQKARHTSGGDVQAVLLKNVLFLGVAVGLGGEGGRRYHIDGVPRDDVLEVDLSLKNGVIDHRAEVINEKCRTAADKAVHCLQLSTAKVLRLDVEQAVLEDRMRGSVYEGRKVFNQHLAGQFRVGDQQHRRGAVVDAQDGGLALLLNPPQVGLLWVGHHGEKVTERGGDRWAGHASRRPKNGGEAEEEVNVEEGELADVGQVGAGAAEQHRHRQDAADAQADAGVRVGRQVEGEEGDHYHEEGGQVESSEVEEEPPLEEDVHQQTGVALKELRASPGVPESGDAGQENVRTVLSSSSRPKPVSGRQKRSWCAFGTTKLLTLGKPLGNGFKRGSVQDCVSFSVT
ncbi:hypothetical protein TYRP_021235 [Tyrophagus putrescentiae]|nr:hypothetical protein TYRP_021235 [Tyrophagus putrescentiae]